MKKLYIETKDRHLPLDPAIIQKYNLEAGMLTPFTQCLIVDSTGGVPDEKGNLDYKLDDNTGELVNDGISVLDTGFTLSTSEIIDISEGVDSNPNG